MTKYERRTIFIVRHSDCFNGKNYQWRFAGVNAITGRAHNLCTACGKPLLVRYDLARASKSLTRQSLPGRRPDLWRYREVLPVEQEANIVSLGEGFTPLLHAWNLGTKLGMPRLYIKDESQNPTQAL